MVATAPERALFVGNSLTYVGNVPAVFATLAEDSGRPMKSDMIVMGGATLAQRVADGSVARALQKHAYAVMVLQERGGDLIGAFGPRSCGESRQAMARLTTLAKANGVKVLLLGTYQGNPDVSPRLVAAEAAAAAQAGIAYVEVSETLQRLKGMHPELQWFASDGQHPGPALALLDAVAIYTTLFHSAPQPGVLSVHAPIYGSASGLTERLRDAAAPPPRPDTPREVRYPLPVVRTIIAAVSSGGN